MTDQGSTAIAVFDPAEAARSLSRAVKRKSTGIAELLGVDVSSDDPKEAARAKAMLDRFVAVALHAATSDPKILRASEASIIQAIRDSALLGLEPVGTTGDGAIVVYDEKVKVERPGRNGGTFFVEERVPTAHFQPMYRGLLKLARRSDQIAHIDAHVVYQGDKIELDLGSEPSVKHYPVLDGTKRGEIIGAYAVAELTNGRRYADWMTTAEIEVVRKSSRGGQSSDSPWVRFWSEMARKTILRRLMKRLPLETMAEHALRIENETEAARGFPAPEPVAGLVAATSSSARKRLRSRFVADEADANVDDAPGTVPALAPPEPTEDAPAEDPAVSVDPRGAEVVDEAPDPAPTPLRVVSPAEDQAPAPAGWPTGEEFRAKKGTCGATSNPDLGAVEVCDLPAGHTAPDGRPSPHQATGDDGKPRAKWPNR